MPRSDAVALLFSTNMNDLEHAIGLGNHGDGHFHVEEELRGRVGRNMKTFLMALFSGLDRRSRLGQVRAKWYALKGAGSEALDVLNSVQKRRAFVTLERQGYIRRSTSMKNGKKVIIFSLTEKGIALQNYYGDEEKMSRLAHDSIGKRVLDGKLRAISWDIPEALRKKRALFRDFVRSLGFRLIHRSFYIIDFDATSFISSASELLGIGRYIHFGFYKPSLR